MNGSCLRRRITCIAALLSGALLFVSCNNCRCIDPDNIGLNFIRYDRVAFDTVILKKYEKGGGFARLIDSSVFDRSSFVLQERGDTIFFPVRLASFSLEPRFDYLIVLPRIAKSIRLSDIKVDEVTASCSGKVQCVNPLVSLLVDGTVFYFNQNSYELYLRP